MSLDELKKLQEEIIKKNRICSIVGWLIFLIEVAITVFVFIKNDGFLFHAPIIIGFEVIFLIFVIVIMQNTMNGKNIKIFKNEFKNTFVKSSLQKYFDNLTYVYEKGFSEEFIESTGMIDTGDRFNSNDYISGTYKDIKFEQSDIHIEEEHESTDSDGNTTTTWVTTFEGRWMIFDFNKPFKANIQVASSYFGTNYLSDRRKYSKVRMDDTEFNKMFNVYAESEHEAFYILTPHFMEKIKNLKLKLNCNVMFCFIDNKLHIAINDYKDSFEYNVLKRINESEIEKEITKDIKVITDFVDELNLDNDLFKEEN